MNQPVRSLVVLLALLGLTLSFGCATTPSSPGASALEASDSGWQNAGAGDRFMRIPIAAPVVPIPSRAFRYAAVMSCRSAPGNGAFVILARGAKDGVRLGDRGFLMGQRSVTIVVVTVQKTRSEARIGTSCKKLRSGSRISFQR